MSDIKTKNNEKETRFARGERLSRIRSMTNLSRSEIEKRFGIKESTLRSWEVGRATGLTERGARLILPVFQKLGVQCSVGWLLHGTGIPPILLDEIVSAPKEKPAFSDVVLPEEIQLFLDTQPHALSLQVQDDGMEPVYCKGDYVAGVRCYQEAILNVAVGKDCIVETQGGEILLRRVLKGSKNGYYSLQCINLATIHPLPYCYDVEILSAAPVILLRRATII